MEYVAHITEKELRKHEEEKKYLSATKKMIAEMKFNLQRAKKAGENVNNLTALYESIACLGRDTGLSVETEKSIYLFVKQVRGIFEKEFG